LATACGNEFDKWLKPREANRHAGADRVTETNEANKPS
jgi:hypothetical protein